MLPSAAYYWIDQPCEFSFAELFLTAYGPHLCDSWLWPYFLAWYCLVQLYVFYLQFQISFNHLRNVPSQCRCSDNRYFDSFTLGQEVSWFPSNNIAIEMDLWRCLLWTCRDWVCRRTPENRIRGTRDRRQRAWYAPRRRIKPVLGLSNP